MVSIIEEFVVARIKEIIESRRDEEDRITSDALEVYSNRIEQNWDNRIKVAKDWLNLDLKRESCFVDFQTFVEVRNSVVHGNGMLTRRQSENEESRTRLVDRLKSVDVEVQTNYVQFGVGAIEVCAESGRDFIELFDGRSKSLT
jgi:hypothetical protein